MGNVKIIAASAGSGKTYRLAYEYVKSVVENPSLYRHILAVTFTNKATEEMSGRILERLHELASGDPKGYGADGKSGKPSPYLADLERELSLDEPTIRARAAEAQRLILHDYSRFAVLTIDRFFQRLIRSFIRELGVEVNFNLELETDSLLELAADALIEDSSTDEALRDRLFAAARDRLDENKRWNVKEPLVALGKELFGEQYRRAPQNASTIIDEVVGRAHEVQSRFVKVAREMLRMIGELGLGVGDFKGKSKGLVPWLEKIVRSGEFIPPSNYVRQELEGDTLLPALRRPLSELDTLYKDNHRLVNSAQLLRENRHNFLLLSDLQSRIERICVEQNIMPIAETNRIIARLVGGNDTPFIFEKAGSYFSRFMIDEFQDTSASQWANFVPLLRNAIAGEEGTPVMLIGDIKQAIYRWRGGDWQILSRRVHGEMGRGRVEQESLDVNYRSMRRVVEFNNAAVGLVAQVGNETLNALVADGLSHGAIDATEAKNLTDMLAEAYVGHVQKPCSERDEGYVTLTIYGPCDTAGADAGEGSSGAKPANPEYIPPVVEKIEELQARGFAAGDIAVLVRTNTQGARVAQMLLARKNEMAAQAVDSGPGAASQYCYDVVTQDALMVGTAAISRFIIACLSLAVDPGDTIQHAIYNKWLGRAFDELLGSDAAFFSRLAALSPEEAFEEIVLRFELQDRAADVAYIQAIHQQIVSFSARSVADIPLFLKWWNERGATASITMQGRDAGVDKGSGNGSGPGGGAITISTVHKSKGLQYKAVIVPYMSWKTEPDNSGRKLVVWAEGVEGCEKTENDQGTPSSGEKNLGPVPINYKKEMAASFFAPRYYREQVLAHIDAMNLFYVAVTRAEQELHLMVSSNPRDGRSSVGNILRGVLREGDDAEVFMGEVRGVRMSFDGPCGDNAPGSHDNSPDNNRPCNTIKTATTEVFAFGRPVYPKQTQNSAPAVLATGSQDRFTGQTDNVREQKTSSGILRSYPTARPDAKVKLSLPSTRYFEDDVMSGRSGTLGHRDIETSHITVNALTSRQLGVSMHRAFEGAVGREDVLRALDRMLASALISKQEHSDLQLIIDRTFNNPLVAEWFGPDWDTVRNEGDIMLPRSASPTPVTRRPDRVMLRGDRAVIVDYKFGRQVLPSHSTQLREYMSLLANMGYTTVEGYLWYVSLDKIVEVRPT